MSLQERELLKQALREIEDKGISLSTHTRLCWPSLETEDYIHGWHLDAMSEHLEACSRGEITRLAMNVPPGCMKSLKTSVMWPSWEWGPQHQPHLKIMSTSHGVELALRDNAKMRDLVTSEYYQQAYPHVQLMHSQNAKGYFANTSGGFRRACAFTSLTGHRVHRLIIDDPLSVDDGNSKQVLQTVGTTFLTAVPTRLADPKKSVIVLVMQRLNELDPTGLALARELGYVHLMLPMEFESKRKCTTIIGFSDPRTKEDELLFAERFPQSVVDDYKISMGSYVAAGQLQQRPAPADGGMIKREWFGWYEPEYDENYRVISPSFDYLIQSWDTGFKEKTHNDPSVCLTGGVNNRGVYLTDRFKERLSFPLLKKKAIELGNYWNLSELLIEDKASGQSLIQSLKDETNLPVVGIEPAGDKVSRLSAVSAYIEAGRLFLPKGANWVEDFISELCTFPNAAHDDQVDALSQMLLKIFLRGRPQRITNFSALGGRR